MLVKIFSNKGGGSAKASIDYLQGKEKNREGARVLRGDPELSQSIAESLEFKNAYTVGCLSFEEPNISEAAKGEIMDKFEKTIFAGMNEDQYNLTWIEHTDKGRLELNFFIPNVELKTQKRLQPYYDKADRPLVDNFKKVVNQDYGLTSPDAPEKRQLTKINLNTPRSVKELKEGINSIVSERVSKGEIKSQEELAELFNEAGLEVSRITKKSISIKNPDGGRNVRFDGELYGKEFYENTRSIEQLREYFGQEQSGERSENRADSYQAIESARRKLGEETLRRAEKHKKLYPEQNAFKRDIHSYNSDFVSNMGLLHLADIRTERTTREVEPSASPIRIIREIYKSRQTKDSIRREGEGALHLHDKRSENIGERLDERKRSERIENRGLRGFIDELSKRTKNVIQRVREKATGITERAKEIAEYMHKADEREQGIERVTARIRDFNGAVQNLNGESAKHDEFIESRKHEIPRTDREINKIERAIEYKEERSQDRGMSMSR